jgi:HAD superfamily hydrolase (TIGR01509 family)
MGGIKALLFDNDGVLVATEHLYYQATREVVQELGYDLTENEYRELFLKNSMGIRAVLEKLKIPSRQFDDYREKRNQLYLKLISATNTLIPRVKDVVTQLSGQYRLVIVTSSWREHFHAIHQNTGILPLFEWALTRQDYQHSKPDPEPYLTAIHKLQLKKEQCLIIEDSPRGAAAAAAAKIKCVAIPYGLTNAADFPDAYAVLPDITRLPGFLEKISQNKVQ